MKQNQKDESNKARDRKNYQKTGNKIYIKWKGYDNLFNR